jgi:small-conductance mechanosensitive channel
MKLHTLLNLSLAAGLLSPAYILLSATSCGAEPLSAPATKQEKAAVDKAAVEKAAIEKAVDKAAADLDPASQRVDQSKIKLEQARAQLSAARSMLKAAEAEFRAAKADKEALSARNEATKLADASGLKDDGVQPVQPQAAITFGTNRLYPAASAAPAPAATPAPDMSSTRIQQADFNAPQKDGDGAPVANLRPTKTAEESQPASPVQ